ncbi:MAG: beta-ketoacyl-[acyl-carrier-protein] synthase family protein [Deltaproteobacteria bacterium]|nr:beta-ketoacyl-[acyl-carrier-protein] synthase family protein [Deltaproteobacteria bacterium]
MRRVVVTGLGAVSSLGIGKEAHWETLVSARSATKRIERFTSQRFPVDVAAEIPETLLEHELNRFPRKQRKFFSRATLFAMIGSSLAFEDAGLQQGAIDPTRLGVFLGTLFTSIDFYTFLRWLGAAESSETVGMMDLRKANSYCMSSINPTDFSLKTMPNLTGGHVAIAHNAQGICRVIADGCTGGLQAIGQAFLAVKEDQLDLVLCGGAEAPLEELTFLTLCAWGFLANGNEEPYAACRPFDKSRRGIYGEILGFGAAAGDVTFGHQSEVNGVAERLSLSIRRALAEAGLEKVHLIAANGDSTKSHDLAETMAIKEVFGWRAKEIPISATKSMHGHLVSASGALEMITCFVSLERGIIPPTVNLRDPDPLCDLDYVPNVPRPSQHMTTALVNAVGLFGESTSIVIRKAA